MSRCLLIILFPAIFLLSCTSSRWVVTDQQVIDADIEPELVDEKSVLLLDHEPDHNNPVISFSAYQVLEKEYQQRVKVERTVQRYRPRWLFLTLGIGGAAFASLAANTDLIAPGASSEQKLALNLTSVVLAGLAFSNMEPVGDPIFTGESELMRRSGTEIISDTLRSEDAGFDLNVDLEVRFENDVIRTETDLALTNGQIDINLVNITDELDRDLDQTSVIELILSYNGTSSTYEIPIPTFLSPYVTVSEPVALLRNAPVVNDINIITEVGSGSSLELISEENDDWYRVRFGGSEVFLSKNAGDIEWMSEAVTGSPDVFEFADVPFGEIDVENSVPILKSNNPADRAIILTNGFLDDAEPRQYLDRDHRLFRFYMRHALQIRENQIFEIEMDSTDAWIEELRSIPGIDEAGSLHIYLSGFASIEDPVSVYLTGVDDRQNGDPPVLTSVIFDELERINPGSLFLLADLEFTPVYGQEGQAVSRSVQAQALQFLANGLLRRIPNSVILFSNRPGQRSSLYTGAGMVNMRHHIFNYYWADAIKRRNTRMSDIIRHLENNVDYTSRRLHDRSQEIQAFGNFTLDISE